MLCLLNLRHMTHIRKVYIGVIYLRDKQDASPAYKPASPFPFTSPSLIRLGFLGTECRVYLTS
jgi:hypothetical protein